MLKDTFLNVKSQQLQQEILKQFKCKFDQGKAILDGIEFRVNKTIYKDIYLKVCEL